MNQKTLHVLNDVNESDLIPHPIGRPVSMINIFGAVGVQSSSGECVATGFLPLTTSSTTREQESDKVGTGTSLVAETLFAYEVSHVQPNHIQTLESNQSKGSAIELPNPEARSRTCGNYPSNISISLPRNDSATVISHQTPVRLEFGLNTNVPNVSGTSSSDSSEDSNIGSSSVRKISTKGSDNASPMGNIIPANIVQHMPLSNTCSLSILTSPAALQYLPSTHYKLSDSFQDQKAILSLLPRACMKCKASIVPSISCDNTLCQRCASLSGFVKHPPGSRRSHKLTPRHVEKGVKRNSSERITSHELPSDGYSWRKYGSKKLPNKTYPKSYFRCSAPGCTAKRYVTEGEDRVLQTEYIGEHNHGKILSVSREANTMTEICHLAVLWQTFIVRSDISFTTLAKDFPELAEHLRGCIVHEDYLLLNGFGSLTFNDSNRRSSDMFDLFEIPTDIYPFSILISIILTLSAQGKRLEEAITDALSQIKHYFIEKSLINKQASDSSRNGNSNLSSFNSVDGIDTTDSLTNLPCNKKLTISCKLQDYTNAESDIDFFRWKKYGHKPQKDCRMDSKSYYRCTFPNCPARRTITFLYTMTKEGVRTIESMVVQYESQHLHMPDRTRLSNYDCYRLLNISDQTLNKISTIVDFSIPLSSSYINTQNTYAHSTLAPTISIPTTSITKLDGSSSIPLPTSLTTAQSMLPNHSASHSQALADESIFVSQPANVIPQLQRISSFEQNSYFLFPRVDSEVFLENTFGLSADQGACDCASISSTYSPSYTFATQADYNSYGLLNSGSLVVLNHRTSTNQPILTDIDNDQGLSATLDGPDASSKIPPIKSNYSIPQQSTERDTFSCCSALTLGDESMSLTSNENDPSAQQQDALLGPIMNFYIQPMQPFSS